MRLLQLEEQLKKEKERSMIISAWVSTVIPELLAEQGLSEIKLADGSKVSVKQEFRAPLPKVMRLRRECMPHEWLLRSKG